MNNLEMVSFLEKYKTISSALNLSEDVRIFDKIISFLKEKNIEKDALSVHINKASGETDFNKIISSDEIDLDKYGVDEEIIQNKMDMFNYWSKLDANTKEKFTILELNLIMFFITNKNYKYTKKEKKKIIMDIDMTVRNKRTSESYSKIVV
jgi:hypothetical protein